MYVECVWSASLCEDVSVKREARGIMGVDDRVLETGGMEKAVPTQAGGLDSCSETMPSINTKS